MNTELLVMAAGMGSRFGGLKQIAPIGPNGEIILDFSVQDAVKAGFSKVVFIIKKEIVGSNDDYGVKKTSRWIILLGYIFSIAGGLIGLIIAIYLSTRKDPVARKHGHIQLAIFGFYILLIAVLFATGNIDSSAIADYNQLLSGNFTALNR